MSRRYTRKGPTEREQWPCLLCGHPHWSPHFIDNPVVVRVIEFAGKGGISVKDGSTLTLDQVTDLGTWGPELKLAIARLAHWLGVTPREVVREVVREVIRNRIPEAFKQRAKVWQANAEKWARHEANKGRRCGRDFTVRARRTRDVGSVRESWDGNEFTTRGRRVVDEGNGTERW